MKSIAIHQPNYIPWPGYFFKIHQSDTFVFLDDVQFSNEGMHNYHYIKTSNGPLRLKIPVIQTLGDKINEVKIRNEISWSKKHLNYLFINYNNCKHFEEVYNDFSGLLSYPAEYLADLNIRIIEFICKKLGIKHDFLKSSGLDVRSVREDKIIDICKALNGNIYLSGTGARAYQDENNFTRNGLQLKYSQYRIIEYEQQFEGFQSNVSIIDFLMNCGYNWQLILDKQPVN